MYYFNRFFNIFINRICGILIVIILMLVAFFIGLWHSEASSIRNITLDNLQSPVFFYPFNCTSPTSCSSDTFNVAYDTFNKNTFYYTDSGTSIHNSGVYINYKLNSVLQPGYLYSISTYICSNTNNLLPYKSFTGIGATSYGGTMTYSSKTYGYYSANQVEFSMYPPNSTTGENGYITMQDFNSWFTPLQVNQCGIYYDVFSPGTTSTWYGLQLTRETNANNVNFLLAGYKLTELGIYSASLSSDITNTINTTINSTSQATQESINQLNQEIQEMTSEQQQTNNKLDDLNNNITSNDTTNSDSEGAGFFNDFTLSDNGGISGVITAPLRVINGMLENNNSCDKMSINLTFIGINKKLEIPSGCILWNKVPDSVELVYHTLVCGVFGYILMTNLFKQIEKLKNPKESEVETLDL